MYGVHELLRIVLVSSIFFCNDTPTTEFYTYLHTLSPHDALPICTVADARGDHAFDFRELDLAGGGSRHVVCRNENDATRNLVARQHALQAGPECFLARLCAGYGDDGGDPHLPHSRDGQSGDPGQVDTGKPQPMDRDGAVSGKRVSVRVDRGGV